MRVFGSNIRVDGGTGPGAIAFETAIEAALTQLMAFRAGNAVIKDIWSRAPRHVTIDDGSRPAPHRNPMQSTADASPDDWVAGFQLLERVRGFRGSVQDGALGSGAGSNSLIRFRLDQIPHDCSLQLGPGRRIELGPARGVGEDRNSVLLHECVHASRHMAGVARRRRLEGFATGRTPGPPIDFIDEEELLAITIQNIYACERGLRLRSGHADDRVGNELRARDFWRSPVIFRMLEDFTRAMPALATALAAIRVDYNPIRAILVGVEQPDGTLRPVRPYLRLRNSAGQITDEYGATPGSPGF